MNSWEYDDQEENIKEVATLAKTPRVQPKSQIPTKSIYQKPVVNDEKEENKENAGAATFDLPFHPRGH
ncbi:uncharacterized protein LY89DRAFT_690748 [Mollisia scopiformis]|uniref:Uncharacterized protein n=1 Tax=Mollisia scopiformis TaxID=149040 RepID=A0A132B8M3_MOLSC|nr:uncharacterized protein LY89DRAFT_690748 [Mollisia scopiformis]KUJ08721.1 hypothetical protein LY89DRAFT_690748 [Mollisia scopiformis]